MSNYTLRTAHIFEDFNHSCNCDSDDECHMSCELLFYECLDNSASASNDKKMFSYYTDSEQKDCLHTQFLNTCNHIFECNDQCNCDENCRNCLIQHSHQVLLKIFKTDSCDLSQCSQPSQIKNHDINIHSRSSLLCQSQERPIHWHLLWWSHHTWWS